MYTGNILTHIFVFLEEYLMLVMKKLFFLLVASLGILATSCDSDIESETPPCRDGVQNFGERAVDCGGPCISCETNSLELELENVVSSQIQSTDSIFNAANGILTVNTNGEYTTSMMEYDTIYDVTVIDSIVAIDSFEVSTTSGYSAQLNFPVELSKTSHSISANPLITGSVAFGGTYYEVAQGSFNVSYNSGLQEHELTYVDSIVYDGPSTGFSDDPEAVAKFAKCNNNITASYVYTAFDTITGSADFITVTNGQISQFYDKYWNNPELKATEGCQ